MSRRLAYLAGILLAALLSCTREAQEEGTDGPVIKLTVWTDEVQMATKAGSSGTKEADTYHHENLLTTIDFFFYPGTNPTGDAVYHKRVTSNKTDGYDVFLLEVNSDIVNAIFPTQNQATVYAIANYASVIVEDENDLSLTSISKLGELPVNTDFLRESPYWEQDIFVMSGKQVINLTSRTQVLAAEGKIGLERYACKMTVSVHVEPRVELPSTEVWEPMLGGMEIYLVNAVGSVKLSGEDSMPSYFSYSPNSRHFAAGDQDDYHLYTPYLDPTTKDGKEYLNTYPMYMYPQHWTYGSTQGNDREPYLKLVVPWVRTTENGHRQTQRQYYYKVIIPDDKRDGYSRRFVRNNWYHLNVDVGILGSETDEALLEVTPGSCYMVYWQDMDVVVKEAEIGTARYLSVEKQEYTMNNINSLNVRYTTSHPVIIKPNSIKVTRPYYGQVAAGKPTLGGTVRKAGANDVYPQGTMYLEYSEAQRKALSTDGKDWLECGGGKATFTHVLNNNYLDAKFDHSPYRIAFTLVHMDMPSDTKYAKDIVITQYPAVYIDAHRNSDADNFRVIKKEDVGYTTANGKDLYVSDSGHWGYVWVDAQQIIRHDARNSTIKSEDIAKWKEQGYDYPHANEYKWRVVWYTGGSLNLHRINVTVLPPHSDFVIGDPRTDEPDNLEDNYGYASNGAQNVPYATNYAPGIENPTGTHRQLSHYYPTENSVRTRDMLAPSYRFSTKAAGTEYGNLSYDDAQRRCAGLQEDGYPAGRWRIPTRGEIRFAAILSGNNLFDEVLFANTGTGKFWAADGIVSINGSNVVDASGNSAMVRCVYDSWYWGEERCDPATFLWGDLPK